MNLDNSSNNLQIPEQLTQIDLFLNAQVLDYSELTLTNVKMNVLYLNLCSFDR